MSGCNAESYAHSRETLNQQFERWVSFGGNTEQSNTYHYLEFEIGRWRMLRKQSNPFCRLGGSYIHWQVRIFHLYFLYRYTLFRCTFSSHGSSLLHSQVKLLKQNNFEVKWERREVIAPCLLFLNNRERSKWRSELISSTYESVRSSCLTFFGRTYKSFCS